MRTHALLLLALFAPAGLAAQSHAPPRSHATAKALDPVGAWDIEFEMHGQTTGTVLTISRDKDGKLSGTFEAHGQSITLPDVVVDGRRVELSAGTELVLTLNFRTDTAFSGNWKRGEETGGILGSRRKS